MIKSSSVIVRDEDGAWRRHALWGIPHAYYSRVGWSLAVLYTLVGDFNFEVGARKNADWTLLQQNANGWFDNTGFTQDLHRTTNLHTTAYTIRGMLEIGIALRASRYIKSALEAVNGFIATLDDSLPAGTHESAWRGNHRFSCLTGKSQIAIALLRLADRDGTRDLFGRAVCINRATARTRHVRAESGDVRGAIAGSSPIWGDYFRFAYPNWATKFFAESLMTEARVEQTLARDTPLA